MIHGLRNDRLAAVKKFEIAKRRLCHLGYSYPVIGFSYDSNTSGAHLKKTELHALIVGQNIAQKNGKNLAHFIIDFKKKSPITKIRLIGHSLGSQVILSTIQYLAKKNNTNGIVESVYFFAASIPSNSVKKYGKELQRIVNKKIVNYYSPTDDVLKYGNDQYPIFRPLGLFGSSGKPISKFIQKRVKSQNHRFLSYSRTILSFP